jgi:hypothetical protein
MINALTCQGANLRKLAAYYGDGATEFALQHHLRKFRHEADQMKLKVDPELNKKDGNVSTTTSKSTRTRSAKKPEQVLNGKVKKPAHSTKKRASDKPAVPGIAAAVIEAAVLSGDGHFVGSDRSSSLEKGKLGNVIGERQFEGTYVFPYGGSAVAKNELYDAYESPYGGLFGQE